MFERFTERARSIIVLAQEEARHFNHNYVGTEHLLLGLLREDEGVAALTLRSLKLELDEVREQVESIVGYGEEATGGQVPFTPRSKKVLELALKESMQLGHNYIGTEHLLLGLLRESEGVAARILSNLDVDPDKVRHEVLRRLGRKPGRDPLGRAEEELASEKARRTLFRGQVKALDLRARFEESAGEHSPSQPLLADLDYRYIVRGNGNLSSDAIDHNDLCRGIARALDAESFEFLEQVVKKSGDYILEEFPTVQEITVSITSPRGAGAHSIPGLSVTSTFRR